jgi:RWD domain
MSNVEEQEMEGEALHAIFDSLFVEHPDDSNGCKHWSVDIYPNTATGDDPGGESDNHVAISLHVTLPAHYPESEIPQVEIAILHGLTAEEHGTLLREMAMEEATANLGTPCIFSVVERLREWLLEHNVPGMDDVSMYAQMMRKQVDEQKAMVRSTRVNASRSFHAQLLV